jgi:hypothetical protein
LSKHLSEDKPPFYIFIFYVYFIFMLQAPLGALSPSDFTGLWYLLSTAVAFGFFWAGLERFLLYLLARYPCLRERLEHWKHRAAARGKNFDFIRAFSVPKPDRVDFCTQ